MHVYTRDFSNHNAAMHVIQGDPKTRPHYVWLLTSSKRLNQFAQFWQTSTQFCSEHICKLCIRQLHNTKWRHLVKVSNPDFAFGDCYGNFSIRCQADSRTSRARLLNKIDSSNVSKDGKTEAMHGLLEQRQTLCLLETWYAARRGGVSHACLSVNATSRGMRFAAERRTHEAYL